MHNQDPLSQNQSASAAHQAKVLAGVSKDAQSNPQAYDELKKRLLNEYKKLCNNKSKFEEGQPRYTPQGSQPKLAPQARQLEDDQAQQAHMNVYKPTFIINNSFQNEKQEHSAGPSSASGNDPKKFLRANQGGSQSALKGQLQQSSGQTGMKKSNSAIYDLKPATSDNKAKARTSTTDKTKGGKLASQHQA